jgi:hypothetical protein
MQSFGEIYSMPCLIERSPYLPPRRLAYSFIPNPIEHATDSTADENTGTSRPNITVISAFVGPAGSSDAELIAIRIILTERFGPNEIDHVTD